MPPEDLTPLEGFKPLETVASPQVSMTAATFLTSTAAADFLTPSPVAALLTQLPATAPMLSTPTAAPCFHLRIPHLVYLLQLLFLLVTHLPSSHP